MDALNDLAPPTTSTTRRRAPRREISEGEAQKALLRTLRRLYGAERLLACELRQLFQRSSSLPFRLVLADQRRAIDRQILRLERIIQTKTGAPASSAGPAKRDSKRPLPVHLDLDVRRTAPTREMMAFPLMAAQAGVVAYQSAIALARKVGEIWIMALLTESLNESLAMAIALEDQAMLL
jgi:ferritin-like metal-binding protein YciE